MIILGIEICQILLESSINFNILYYTIPIGFGIFVLCTLQNAYYNYNKRIKQSCLSQL